MQFVRTKREQSINRADKCSEDVNILGICERETLIKIILKKNLRIY